MAGKKKSNKPGPGRPAAQRTFSAAELQHKAIASIERTQERRIEEKPELLQKLYDKTHELTHYKRLTLKEINELRKQVSEVYEDYLHTQAELEAQTNDQLNKRLAALSAEVGRATQGKSLTEAEWNELHGKRFDGSKPRGPKPKRKKLVWELEPGEKGTAAELPAPVDVDAMEKLLEETLMERHIQQQKEEARFLKGKRIRKETAAKRSSIDQSKFWN